MTIQTKFNIGDRVYYMFYNEMRHGSITGMTIYVSKDGECRNACEVNGLSFYEIFLHSTKEDLMKYWFGTVI